MRPALRPECGEAGYTLVEALAGLAALGLLSMVVLAGIEGRSLAWRRMARVGAAEQVAASAEDVLRRRIEAAVPLTIYYVVPPGPDFQGGPSSLVFLGPPPPSQGAGPLRRYRLRLETGGDLVLDSLSDIALDQNRWTGREVLLGGVESLDLAYYGVAKTDRVAAWSAEWRDQSAMPELVRIRVAFPRGDGRTWPDLLVHPAADIDTGCVLAASASGCRGR